MPSNKPSRLRRSLDWLYTASGALAGCFLVAICALVSAQVLGNALDRLLLLTIGRQIGIVIPAYAEIAGFFLSASTFLGLSYTLSRGEHIRVQLLLNRLSPSKQRAAELLACGLALAGSAVATGYTVDLVRESIEFGDTLPGMIAIPLWWPQSAMALGLLILTIAFADAFYSICRGREPHYAQQPDNETSGLQGA